MEPFPHHYRVGTEAGPEGAVLVTSEGLVPLTTAPPLEFGGPGDKWSPETLLVGAAADCFVLTFRAIAAASKLAWTHLECDAEGVLERVDGVARFNRLDLRARLVLPGDGDEERARRLLEKAEKNCLVTNSLVLTPSLTAEVILE